MYKSTSELVDITNEKTEKSNPVQDYIKNIFNSIPQGQAVSMVSVVEDVMHKFPHITNKRSIYVKIDYILKKNNKLRRLTQKNKTYISQVEEENK